MQYLCGLFVGVLLCFSAPANACDGIQEKCPAERVVKPGYKIGGCGHGVHKGESSSDYCAVKPEYAWSSPEFAAQHYKNWVQGNTRSVCSTINNVQHRWVVTFGSVVQLNATTYALNSTHSCNGNQSPYQTPINATASETFYECKNPLYPVGPDAQNMCSKPVQCKAGELIPFAKYPAGTGKICVPIDGNSCEAVLADDLVFCSGQPEMCWSDVRLKGTQCSNSDDSNGSKTPNGCVTAPDGRLICSGNTPNTDAQTGPCVAGQTGPDCLKTETPQSHCTKNPSAPECLNPEPTKCGFIGSKYVCTTDPSGCGTISGQSVCVCQNGGTRPWSGGASSCGSSGGGTDPVTAPGGGGKGGEGVKFGGKCGSGTELNLDCFFENADEIHPEKKEPEFEELDQAKDKIGEAFEHGLNSPASSFSSLVPSGGGGCPTLTMDIPHAGTITIPMPCTQMGWIRSGFEWILNIVMVLYVWRRFRETI